MEVKKQSNEELIQRAQAGDKLAVRQLIEFNTPYVASVARHYERRCRTLELEDLIVAGQMGLMQAIRKFDQNAGTKYITYAAWWVRASIEREIADSDLPIRIPVHVLDTQRKVYLGTFKGSDEKRDRAIVAVKIRNVLSIDSPVGDEGRPLSDVVPAPAPDVIDQIDAADKTRKIRATIQRLVFTPRERAILEKRLMGEATLGEVAELFELSRERIRQLEVSLIRRLRCALEKLEAG